MGQGAEESVRATGSADSPTRAEVERVATAIVDAAVRVHKALGPGLLESACEQCLTHALRRRGLHVVCQVVLPVTFEGLAIDAGYRIDMLVEDCVIVENKVVERLLPIHEAQILTYLRLRGARLGFLLNWNVLLMRDGIQRVVNKL
ncbi:MAG: GxxExxY protein [Anaerolineae bacterium]